MWEAENTVFLGEHVDHDLIGDCDFDVSLRYAFRDGTLHHEASFKSRIRGAIGSRPGIQF